MAISVDATSNGTATDTTLTVSHTCTGTKLVLFVAVQVLSPSGGGGTQSVTYNGVSMTQIKKQIAPNGDVTSIFGLLNPDTGAHNIVLTNDDSRVLRLCGVSYKGVKQSDLPDASNSGSGINQVSFSQSVTIVGSPTWAIMAVGDSVGAYGPSTNSTTRATQNALRVFDTNGITGTTGAYSMSVTGGNGGSYNARVIVSFAVDIITISVSDECNVTDNLSATRLATINTSDSVNVDDSTKVKKGCKSPFSKNVQEWDNLNKS